MTKTMWKSRWYSGRRALTTADVAEITLTSNDDGQVENASQTADNAVRALGRLLEMLHEKGLLTEAEVVFVLNMHQFEVMEDNT